MGDSFDYRLVSWNNTAINAPSGQDLPWGTRLSPSGKVNFGKFFAELRLEGGYAQAPTTPIGDNYFEATPSSTLSDKTFGCWVYKPSDAKDTRRDNFCVRGLNVGYKFTPDFQIRLGRSRYEVTEYENMFMANAYSSTPHWANVYLPYGWLGGELRFDRKREDQTMRRLMFSGGAMNGADGGFLLIGQGLATFAFADGTSTPKITLTAYGIYRGNPHPTTADIIDPGSAHGEGLGIQFDDRDEGIVSGGIGANHQLSSWQTKLNLEGSQSRDEVTTFADVHPGSFRFRGAYSFLGKADLKPKTPYDNFGPGQVEKRVELTASYKLVEGIQASLGYIGVFGQGSATHMGFLGLLTTYGGSVPF